ncbi:MAG: VanZ family protein [Balneola sp.]
MLVATLYPSNGSFSFSFWEYDKLGHFIMFAVWTFLYGLYRASKSDEPPSLWIIFILGSFYGLIIEFLQFLVPTNRNPEALDLVADMFGAMAAIFLLRFLFQSITKDRSDPTT